MKNFLFLFVLAFTMLFGSCADENSLSTVKSFDSEVGVKTDSLALLQAKVQSLNEKMYVNSSVTRGWFSRLFRRVLADAVGGLFGNLAGGPAGAVVGAASFSALCASFATEDQFQKEETQVRMNKVNFAMCDLVPDDASDEDMASDSLGYYHNAVLLDAYSEKVAISEIPQVLLEEVKDSFPNLGSVSHKDSLQIVKAYDKFYSAESKYTGDDDLNSYSEHLSNCYPDQKGEIAVITEFLNGLNYTGNSSKEYVNEVLDLVKQSGLSAEIKRNLRNAIIVGNASNRLWAEDGCEKGVVDEIKGKPLRK